MKFSISKTSKVRRIYFRWKSELKKTFKNTRLSRLKIGHIFFNMQYFAKIRTLKNTDIYNR